MLATFAIRAVADDGPPFPRLANYYLHGAVDPNHYDSLARWDLLVLDTVWSDAQLAELRARNPDVRLFAYVLAYCMGVPPPQWDPWRWNNHFYAQANDMWWRNVDGSVASDWPGMQLVNITDQGPIGPAGNWRTFFKSRLEDLVGPRRALDGVFFDNFWRGLSWEQGRVIRVDSDCSPSRNPLGCDGVMDPAADLDSLWNRALRDVASDARRRFDRLEQSRERPLAILSNGSSDYFPWLNGTLYEGFPLGRGGGAERGNPHSYNWAKMMLAEPGGYLVAPFRASPYTASILNAEWPGTDEAPERSAEFERHKRFSLVSALLGDGYFSLDAGTTHGARWWEPEYDHAGRGKGYLGYAKAEAYRIGKTTGSELVVNGSWSMFSVGWQAQSTGAVGTYARDGDEAYSEPASARLTVTSVEPSGYLKLYQLVPVLGGNAYTLRLWAKADPPQTITAHLYDDACAQSRCLDDQSIEVDTHWRLFEVSFVATGNATAGLGFFVSHPGVVWIDDVSLRAGDTTVYRRDFEHGVVLLNYTRSPQRVDLGSAFRRLSVPGSPVWDGAVVQVETVPPWDGRILLRSQKPTSLPLPEKSRGARFGAEPNPCRQGTALRFSLPQDGPVRLVIYDVAGRRVRTLADGPARTAGELLWNGADDHGRPLPPGIYVARLQTPTQTQSRKLTLLP